MSNCDSSLLASDLAGLSKKAVSDDWPTKIPSNPNHSVILWFALKIKKCGI